MNGKYKKINTMKKNKLTNKDLNNIIRGYFKIEETIEQNSTARGLNLHTDHEELFDYDMGRYVLTHVIIYNNMKIFYSNEYEISWCASFDENVYLSKIEKAEKVIRKAIGCDIDIKKIFESVPNKLIFVDNSKTKNK